MGIYGLRRPSVDKLGLTYEMTKANQALRENPELLVKSMDFRRKKSEEAQQPLGRFDNKLVYMWEREAGLYDHVFEKEWTEIVQREDTEKAEHERRFKAFREEQIRRDKEIEEARQQFKQEFEAEHGRNANEYSYSYFTKRWFKELNRGKPERSNESEQNKRPTNVYMADFETTVYDGQTKTEVWAAAITQLFDETDTVHVFNSLPLLFEYIKALDKSVTLYFHNLKFDGWFWLSYLIIDLGFELAIDGDITKEPKLVTWNKNYQMKNNTVKCAISAMGQWYSITIKVNNKIIEIRDSLKLLPFSVKKIGKSFKTKHRKLNMEYKGYRYAGCEITPEEQKYIANDVLVVKEALEIMFDEGHSKLTIGSCCMSEFKRTYFEEDYKILFPDLSKMPLNKEVYGSADVDEYVRKSYRGGWCFLVKGKSNQRKHNGTTADVNSLYPSMMSSESGNRYPVREPWFMVPSPNKSAKEVIAELDKLERDKKYYFVRFKARFYLRKGKLPFVQIKNNLRWACNECLESSDYVDKKGERWTHYWDMGDEPDTMVLRDTRHEFTMTMTDFRLFREHYRLVDFTVLDYCFFDTKVGIFDDYMETYKKLKQESEGALRELAKLFLNNLYGKMASSTNSNFKIPLPKWDGTITFIQVDANDKQPGYIPCGSAITSYARRFTITAAQMNYYGPDKPGFIYADTDSIHCDLEPEQIKGITVHPTNFCCWKLEAQWDVAWFTRQKTYIEHITHKDQKPVEEPYYDVKCAGMPERCKDIFIKSMEGYDPKPEDDYTEYELSAIKQRRKLEDFTVGLKLPGKLMPKRVPGGIILADTTYEMR